MEFFLGVEGGGTKTELAAVARWCGAAVRVRVGASSLSRNSSEAVAAELARGCEEVCAALGATAGECMAVGAGFASACSHGAEYERLLRGLLWRAKVLVMTDAELALQAAVGEGDGMVVISGTGSIAWGRYAGRTARAGGETPGHDAGSGDWIREQRAEGQLTGAVIFQQAGEALAALLLGCARELGWPAPAAYYHGGVVTHVPEVLAALAAAWPHALAPLPCPPADAAVELARRALSR